MKRMTLLVVSVTAAAVLVPNLAVRAADEQDKDKASAQAGAAKDVLKKCEAALKNVKFARYQAEYRGTGWVKQYVPDLKGTAAIGEPAQHDIPRFRCEVLLTPSDAAEAIELAAGCDGDVYYLVDPKKKIVYADMDEAVIGAHSRNLQRVLLQDFVAKEPLAADLKVENLELKETVDVGGEPCHQVRVVQSADRELTWFISTRDWLPRRVDRRYKNPEGEEGMTQLVITDLVARPTCDAASFSLTVPPGYARTDDFAP